MEVPDPGPISMGDSVSLVSPGKALGACPAAPKGPVLRLNVWLRCDSFFS